eukprot:767594-Hanusia_phi.AAC.7
MNICSFLDGEIGFGHFFGKESVFQIRKSELTSSRSANTFNQGQTFYLSAFISAPTPPLPIRRLPRRSLNEKDRSDG